MATELKMILFVFGLGGILFVLHGLSRVNGREE